MTTRRIAAKITGVGGYLPPRIVTNVDLQAMGIETTDAWIRERTGIVERHYVDPGMATSDLATHAARELLDRTKIAASDVDAIVIATVTPDMMFPSTACLVQNNLGASKAWGFDLSGACAGFTYALTVGAQLAATAHNHVVAIGADTMTSILDFTDRNTCILFGDGAGAVMLEPTSDPNEGILDFEHLIDGSGGKFLNMPAGGSRLPPSAETVAKRQHYVHQEGASVFKYAVTKMADVAALLLERNGFTGADVALVVPHQANLRIIRAMQDRLGVPDYKVMVNIDRYGNTTAGTIPLALRDALAANRLKKGDLVLIVAVGAGYTVGGVLLRWAF